MPFDLAVTDPSVAKVIASSKDSANASAPDWMRLPGINDPKDGQFASDFVGQLKAMLPAGTSDAQIQQAIQKSSWYGGLGSGSNAYAAALETANHLGANVQADQGAVDAFAKAAVDRSPEGQARAQDTSSWNTFRDNFEAAGVVAANYFFPGSGIVTSQLVSDGAKENLGDSWGRIALIASGVAGGMNDQMANYGRVADSVSGATATSATGTANTLTAPTVAEGGAAAAPSAAENATGLTTNANRFLVADASGAGGTMTDVPQGLYNDIIEAPAGAGAGGGGGGAGLNVNGTAGSGLQPTASTPFSAPGGTLENAGTFTPNTGGSPVTSGFDAGTNIGAGGSRGIISTAMDYAYKNPMVGYGALQLGGGLIKGAADAKTAKEINDRKIAAEQSLQSQKTDEALRLQAGQRAAVQGGSYFDAAAPYTANGTQPLRRPDGSLVYVKRGIIGSAIR